MYSFCLSVLCLTYLGLCQVYEHWEWLTLIARPAIVYDMVMYGILEDEDSET